MELLPWCIAATSLLIGCWVQTALGFGMAVIAAPLIILVEPKWVPAPITATALILSFFNIWSERQHVQLNKLWLPFVTRIPGTIVGAWLLLQLNVFWLQVFVAGSVMLAVVISHFGTKFEYTQRRMGVAAFVSGIMGTTTSIGGPPMALVMQHGAPPAVRANLSVYFAYSCTLSLIAYAYIGLLDKQMMQISLSFIPLSIIGFYFGKKARRYVDNGRFRPLLLCLCAASGLAALGGALIKL